MIPDTGCFLLQVSFGFLNNLFRVIKDTLALSESDGPTLLELLSKASGHSTCRHNVLVLDKCVHYDCTVRKTALSLFVVRLGLIMCVLIMLDI